MSNELLTGILLFGIIQALFFALLFFTKREALADKIIGLWLLILALHVFLVMLQNLHHSILISMISVSITLIHGPFLFAYVYALIHGNDFFNPLQFFHVLPFIVALGMILVPGATPARVIGMAGACSGLTYGVLSILQLQRHRHQIRNSFSFTEQINLSWLTRLVIGILIIWTGAAVLVVLTKVLAYHFSLTWFFTIVPVFIFYLGFYGIRQKTIFIDSNRNTPDSDSLANSKEPEPKATGYYKSGLQPDKMPQVFDQLQETIQTRKLHLNATLSLADLSKEARVPAHYITQTLNEFAESSFYDFINNQRILEFKNRLNDPRYDHYTLLGIAFDCGFNSKSTFNRIFKQHTNMSPLEFKKSLSR
jgi:AraC-like DNA-binding protein